MIVVVIPSHNRREKLLRCLNSLASMQVQATPIVVLDGCSDGSQQAVRQQFPGAQLVEGDGSLWWSGSINAGLEAGRRLGASHFLLLNDDVTVHPRLLEHLLETSRQFPDGLVGSVVTSLESPGEVWCAGGEVDWLGSGTWMRKRKPDQDQWRARWLPGMGTLIPNSVLERLGMMDAVAFPQYFGDTDFSLRVSRAGLPVRVCGRAEIYNETASTGLMLRSGPVDWNHVKNVLFSIRSHADLRTRLRFWGRHCPKPLIPLQVARFYGPALASILKNLLLHGLAHGPESTRSCTFCGQGGRLWPASRREPLYRCQRCGLIENLRSGSSDEEEARYLDVVFDSPEEVARQQYGWLSQQYVGPPGRILDIGCGAGAFLRECQNSGWDVRGVELSPPAAELARKRLGEATVFCGDLRQASLPGNFDVITLWDVLDHLDEPGTCLEDLYSRLNPGGMLLIRVRNGPVHLRLRNLEWLSRQWLGYPRRSNLLGVVHRFGFTVGNLRDLLQRYGFARIEVCQEVLHSSNRDRVTGSGPWAGLLKRLLQPLLSRVGRWSGYRLYPSTSIMVRAFR